jgi:hypothetical protein
MWGERSQTQNETINPWDPQEKTSMALSGLSVRHINTSVQLGKQCFNGVCAGVRREEIFLGNGLLSKFRLTIDTPGNSVIWKIEDEGSRHQSFRRSGTLSL